MLPCSRRAVLLGMTALVPNLSLAQSNPGFSFLKAEAVVERQPLRVTITFPDYYTPDTSDLYLMLSPSKKPGPEDLEGLQMLGPLKTTKGTQSYSVPKGIDVNRFPSVVVWCKEFNVLEAYMSLRVPG